MHARKTPWIGDLENIERRIPNAEHRRFGRVLRTSAFDVRSSAFDVFRHLFQRCHPERSAALGAESKDPVKGPAIRRLQTSERFGVRDASEQRRDPSTALRPPYRLRSAQDDSRPRAYFRPPHSPKSSYPKSFYSLFSSAENGAPVVSRRKSSRFNGVVLHMAAT